MAEQQHGIIKRIMAKRCDVCPPCRYARAHPETVVGRALHWHGKYCPFWKAWQEVYGAKAQSG